MKKASASAWRFFLDQGQVNRGSGYLLSAVTTDPGVSGKAEK